MEACLGRGTDVRLRGDEVGRPVLGLSPALVGVDLTVNCPKSSGTLVLRSLGSGSNSASGAGMGSSSERWRWR